MAKHPVAGSDKAQPEGTQCVGQCDPNERIEVVVMLRRRDEDGFRALMQKVDEGKAPPVPVSREEFEQRFGAAPNDIAKVEAFAEQHQLQVVRAEVATRSVVLSGAVAQFEAAFGVKLERFEHHASGAYRGHAGAVQLPDEIHDMVKAVLGLDSRPQAHPHFRIRPPIRPARAGQATSFTPLELARLYGFPDGDGAGQCIGIIELGGGYSTSDLSSYFSGLGLVTPTVVVVSVDQAKNTPTGDPGGPDGEVTLDIEVAGAIAPAAKLAVYFSPNSDAGFIDAVNRAIHDTANQPSVISISWGAPESSWTSQSIQSFNDVLQSAAALGVTICAASGDSGSSDGSTDGSDQVDFPASSPYVLACGGTQLDTTDTTISREVVWNDGAQGGAGGGGVSTVFALPVWQKGLSATLTQGGMKTLGKRGVPDVAGNASPQTGYEILIDGSRTVVGGTSAVAPLWAGLIARINATQGSPAGFLQPKLYAAKAAGRDITQGNNGSYEASTGWDACTGLGSPNGATLAAAVK
ncbi:S53 family peptidase [Pararobbsia alpina]|uniref:Pseudomonalisin n=1 Tax=Pararobbsia alpina TaxID=621374 RepID=A0A6S7B827_9BURK|nr:S53 family peptidase [Pararobbsia alpina]CAB3780535.1 Pseudomonalisin [Pararobbsia alpina]